MKITGLSLPDNCSLNFHANGIKVRVSLNIEKGLLKYITRDKVSKGDKHYVYWCAKDIPLKHCSAKNIENTYMYLLNNAMINVRKYKQYMLEEQINNIRMIQNNPKY
jgi:hypothetical protein